jgi:hypothetical protein
VLLLQRIAFAYEKTFLLIHWILILAALIRWNFECHVSAAIGPKASSTIPVQKLH